MSTGKQASPLFGDRAYDSDREEYALVGTRDGGVEIQNVYEDFQDAASWSGPSWIRKVKFFAPIATETGRRRSGREEIKDCQSATFTVVFLATWP